MWKWILPAILALAAMAPAQSNAPVPVEGAAMVETSDFGVLPSAIIFPSDQRVMVLVPAGTYRIGLPDPARTGLPSDEGPVATVELGTFYIDKHEVTRGEYTASARRIGASLPRDPWPAGELSDDAAVSAISYFDALSWAEAMRKDLPTEAEWEVAARGAEELMFPWGNSPEENAANIGLGSTGRPRAGGAFARDRSPFGAMDMAGNVSEWVKDDYVRDFYRRVDGQRNPLIDELGESKSVRGGNFFRRGDGRLTQRQPGIPATFRDDIGFRTVFRLRPPPEATPTPERRATPTPTPTRAERFDALLGRVRPLFQDPNTPLPEDLRPLPRREGSVPVWNQTPFTIVTGVLDTESGRLFDFPRFIEAGGYDRVRPPAGGVMNLVAYAQGGTLGQATHLGPVSAEASGLVVLSVELFTEIVGPGPEASEPVLDAEATQVYAPIFRPSSLSQTIHNLTGHPVEVTVALMSSARSDATVVRSETRVLDDRQTTIVRGMGPGQARVTARYVGATAEHTSIPLAYQNQADGRVRILKLQPARGQGETVEVFMRSLPVIDIVRIESQVAPAEQGRFITQ